MTEALANACGVTAHRGVLTLVHSIHTPYSAEKGIVHRASQKIELVRVVAHQIWARESHDQRFAGGVRRALQFLGHLYMYGIEDKSSSLCRCTAMESLNRQSVYVPANLHQ